MIVPTANESLARIADALEKQNQTAEEVIDLAKKMMKLSSKMFTTIAAEQGDPDLVEMAEQLSEALE